MNRIFSQTQGFSIDSFRTSVNKLSSDSEKVNFIIERAKTLDCDDSATKLLLANEAKQLAIKISWPTGIYKSNRTIGDIYIECQKNPSRGFEILRESITLAEENGDIKNQALAYENLAKKHLKLNQYDISIDLFGRALLLNPDADLRIGILADIGYAYSVIGDYPNTIVYYDSSLKLVETEIKRKKKSDVSDSSMIIGLQLNMADIYLSMLNKEKALANYTEALKLSKTVNNKRFIVLCLTGLGKTYKQLKNYAIAIEYFNKGLQECKGFNRFEDEVVLLNEMAKTYLDSGNLDLAKEYAYGSLRLAEGQNYRRHLSKTNTTYGNVLIRIGQTKAAIDHLKEALKYSLETKVLSDQRDAWYGLTNAYKKNGNFDLALDALSNYYSIRDSAQRLEKTNEAIRKDLENTNKTERLKQQADYNRKLERARLVTYSGYIGLALVMLLAYFMYRNFKTQKKYNALLSKEKKSHLAHIEAQSNVLSDIAHIQAHEIRGPVSAIMGYVQIFNYEDPADPENKEIMEWIGITAEKLDSVVRNVVGKENELRIGHKEDERSIE